MIVTKAAPFNWTKEVEKRRVLAAANTAVMEDIAKRLELSLGAYITAADHAVGVTNDLVKGGDTLNIGAVLIIAGAITEASDSVNERLMEIRDHLQEITHRG